MDFAHSGLEDSMIAALDTVVEKAQRQVSQLFFLKLFVFFLFVSGN